VSPPGKQGAGTGGAGLWTNGEKGSAGNVATGGKTEKTKVNCRVRKLQKSEKYVQPEIKRCPKETEGSGGDRPNKRGPLGAEGKKRAATRSHGHKKKRMTHKQKQATKNVASWSGGGGASPGAQGVSIV